MATIRDVLNGVTRTTTDGNDDFSHREDLTAGDATSHGTAVRKVAPKVYSLRSAALKLSDLYKQLLRGNCC